MRADRKQKPHLGLQSQQEDILVAEDVKTVSEGRVESEVGIFPSCFLCDRPQATRRGEVGLMGDVQGWIHLVV